LLVEKLERVGTRGFSKQQLIDLFLKWMEKKSVKRIVIDGEFSEVEYFEELQ
jgi:hypothetical protein